MVLLLTVEKCLNMLNTFTTLVTIVSCLLIIIHTTNNDILVKRFDARDHGISDSTTLRRGVTLGIREHRDIISAIDYLQEKKGIKQVAVFGVSCVRSGTVF